MTFMCTTETLLHHIFTVEWTYVYVVEELLPVLQYFIYV